MTNLTTTTTFTNNNFEEDTTMTNTAVSTYTEKYDELEDSRIYLEEEIRILVARIEYTVKNLMEESPLVPQHLAEMRAELAETITNLELVNQYAEDLASYDKAA
jgi:hypothetical protein